ncbi:MAG: DinB family protein [Vicinamibacteria bacterium]|nr:DinB family protein [Vicinamibacteria bacterium]
MNPRLVPLIALLHSSEALFDKALSGLTREQGLARLGDGANPHLWIAAHLASARYGLGLLIGLNSPCPWGERFTRGSKVGEPSQIPEVHEVRVAWASVNEALGPRLGQLTDCDLDATSPRRFPTSDPSVLGAIGFLVYHEAYHIGQLALIRKALGLGGLVG